jgi:hypothetical protein
VLTSLVSYITNDESLERSHDTVGLSQHVSAACASKAVNLPASAVLYSIAAKLVKELDIAGRS